MTDVATAVPTPTPTPAGAGAPLLHSFSIPWMESHIHVQLWLLSGSALVWVGDRSCTFGALSLAMQTQMDAAPAVSNLLGRGGPSSGSGDDSQGGGEGDEAGAGMAARISKVMRMPVFVSLNIGPALTAGQGLEGMAAAAGPELHAVVERAVLKELKTCQKLAMLTPSPAVQ